MTKDRQSRDHHIVRQCLSGSERAWEEFYDRFVGLMRSVVGKSGHLSKEDVDDITQSAFLSMTSALENYDFHQSLPRFVCVVTERVLVDEYRSRSASKRGSDAEMVDLDDSVQDGIVNPGGDSHRQDIKMQRAQEGALLTDALRGLDPRCRRLIELRYFGELPFEEIAGILGSTKNTQIVAIRRCLEKLRTSFRRSQRRGVVF
jgi:RNA polymerase sigma factor (sigma-70 family)